MAATLHRAGAMASLLKSRAVVRFTGPDTVNFLQGLVTNDLRGLGETAGVNKATFLAPNIPSSTNPPIYAALLTPQGRFLFDMFIYRVPLPYEKLDSTGSGPGPMWDGSFDFLVDVDGSVVDEFLETFRKYRLRSKVEIENIAQDFCCWQRYGGSLSKNSLSVDEPDAAAVGWGGQVDLAGVSASQRDENGLQWFRDPRLECLGFRGIFPSDTTPPLVEADKETDEQNFILWRMENGIAEGTTEIPKGEAIPLEYNLAALNAISFDKGCYVGQELVARTHHQGVIRKRLLPLRFTDDKDSDVGPKVAPYSEVVDTTVGKKAGIVTAAMGSRGLGLLRLDAAFKGMPCLAVDGHKNIKVEAFRPNWWPPQWASQNSG